MEKDYFLDRHPDCRSLKAVEECKMRQGEVFICEKIMQTVATELSDLTRVTVLAILSNDDHPRGLKIKGVDSNGIIRIGRITYFIYEECIKTTHGMIPIESRLYPGYFYWISKWKLPKIENYELQIRLHSDDYFLKQEEMEEKIQEESIQNGQMYQRLIQIQTKQKEYTFSNCTLIADGKTFKNLSVEQIYHQVSSILHQEPIPLQFQGIEKKQVKGGQ